MYVVFCLEYLKSSHYRPLAAIDVFRWFLGNPNYMQIIKLDSLQFKMGGSRGPKGTHVYFINRQIVSDRKIDLLFQEV